MADLVRLIDSGVDDARRQIAYDQALIELHKAGRVPDTLRFLRFPPTVLVGRHQVMAHEVRLAHCRATGIGLARRMTGGGAIYLDPGQVGWELVLSRRRLPAPTLAGQAQAICEAVAAGLSAAFRIDARFRPPGDIEVGGARLGGSGGLFDGDTLVYQGTVLIDLDPARILAALNVPAAAAGGGNQGRLTTLKALLGDAPPPVASVQNAVRDGLAGSLGLTFEAADRTADEAALATALHDAEIGTEAFVMGPGDPRRESVHEAHLATQGGRIGVFLRLEGHDAARRIREAFVTGDFHVDPARLVLDLEAALRGASVADAPEHARRFVAEAKCTRCSVTPDDFRAVVEAAIAARPMP